MAFGPSRIGDDAASANALPSGGTNELFLKVFAGEVLTTFAENNIMMPLHRVRTITSGKSASFPVTGVASAKYHTAGESVYDTSTPEYLTQFNHAERVLYIDDLLISGTFMSSLDEAKNHYDVRSIYSTEIGRELASVADKNLLRTVIGGARASVDRFGGASTTYLGESYVGDGAADGYSGDELVDHMFRIAQKMDEKNVPGTDRFCVLNPAHYYLLINENKDAINRDYGNEGNGSVANPGEMISVAGIRVMKSNNLPSANEATSHDALHGSAGVMNDVNAVTDDGYSGEDYSKTVGVAFHKEAIGTVKLMDLGLETEYSVERQGNLLLAKYAMGHGVLREECCYEMKTT
jgi:hypothetical protein